MRKGACPPCSACSDSRRDGPAGSGEARQPRAARMLSEMDDKVVAACAQAFQELPFDLGLHQRAKFLPLTVYRMQLADRWMQRQHFGGVGINEGVNFDVRRVRFQYR